MDISLWVAPVVVSISLRSPLLIRYKLSFLHLEEKRFNLRFLSRVVSNHPKKPIGTCMVSCKDWKKEEQIDSFLKRIFRVETWDQMHIFTFSFSFKIQMSHHFKIFIKRPCVFLPHLFTLEGHPFKTVTCFFVDF